MLSDYNLLFIDNYEKFIIVLFNNIYAKFYIWTKITRKRFRNPI